MEEYWIGKNIDVEKIWRDFENGKGYIDKYRSTEMCYMEVVFDNYSKEDAIFNFEAIFKSFKSAFHDFKREVFSSKDYEVLAPLYLYEVKRGTEDWIWVAEPSAAVEFAVAFWIFVKAGLHAIDKYIDFEKKRFELLNQKAALFEKIKESSHPTLMIDYMKAKTFIGRNKAFRRLAEQNLKEIKLIDPKTGKPLLHLSDE